MSKTLDQARDEMRKRFGFPDFRPGQEDVVSAVLAGRPTLAVMPTGAGKSLCFQLPAVMSQSVSLVVAPLISLMKDQVDQLRARGIASTYINSSLSEEERAARLRGLRSGEFTLVYVAPERIRSPQFLEAIASVPLGLLAIDEAHCISTWGHDFRPEYARLGELRSRVRPAMTVALTATATPEVRRDIVHSLRMANPAVFVTGFERPNLTLEVMRVSDERQKAAHAFDIAAEAGSGIIYTATRKHCESLAIHLQSRRVDARPYHAGLPDSHRTQTQEDFASGSARVIVATNAFGMGVDKADVRFVIHADIPRSVEAYYQEIGRAGRDGLPSRATLLFNHSNVFLQESLVKISHPTGRVVSDVWDLLRNETLVHIPVSSLAARLGANEMEVSAALRLLEHAGHIARSQRNQAPAEVMLARASASPPPEVSALFELLRLRAGPSAFRPIDTQELAAALGQDVRAVRRGLVHLADSGAIHYRPPLAGRAIRIVDKGLAAAELRVDMAQVDRRRTQEALLLRRITAYAYARSCRWRFLLGYFGASKSDRCGRCDNCLGLPRRAFLSPPPLQRERYAAGNTRLETLRLYEEGASLRQIARSRGLRPMTIARHLGDLLRAGHAIDVERLVPRVRRRLVVDVAPSCSYRPPLIKRALPEDFTYEEIVVALAARHVP